MWDPNLTATPKSGIPAPRMALTRLDMGGAQDEGLPSLTRVLTSSRTVSGNISPTVTGLSGLSHALGAGPRIIEDAYLSKEMCIRVIGKGGGYCQFSCVRRTR